MTVTFTPSNSRAHEDAWLCLSWEPSGEDGGQEGRPGPLTSNQAARGPGESPRLQIPHPAKEKPQASV
jgi:hypothetical protein